MAREMHIVSGMSKIATTANIATTAKAPVFPVIDHRAVLLASGGLNMPLLFAFQGLGLPPGMLLTRTLTRTRAAKIINEFLGCKAVTRASRPARPLPGAGALEQYLTWAIAEAERRNPGMTLEVFGMVEVEAS
jgi:hypothetical protein